MTTEAASIEALVKRLETMERRNRRLLLVGTTALLLGAAATILLSKDLVSRPLARPRAANVVEAERFVLRDALGLVHAELAVDDHRSAALRFFGRDGRYRLQVTPAGISLTDGGAQRAGLHMMPGTRASDPSASVLHLADADGKPRGSLTVLADGSSRFLLSDPVGKGGASIQADAGGSARVALTDPDGRNVAWLGALPDRSRALVVTGEKGASVTISTGPGGTSEILLRDGGGKERAALALLSDGMPFFRLSGENPLSGAALGVTASGATVLELLDEEGKAGTTLATASGSGGLLIRDKNGKEVAGLTTTGGRWPRLQLSGDGTNVGALMTVSPDGASGLTLHDRLGRPRAVLGQITVGKPPGTTPRADDSIPFSLTFVGRDGKIVKRLPP